MLKNYIRIAFRNIRNNITFSFLNIFGLAVGVAACILILQYVQFELSYEKFHEKSDQIYRVTVDLYNGQEYIETDCETYGPLGPALKEQMPEVLDYVRFFHADIQEVKVDAKKFFEDKIFYTDPSVFSIFSVSPIAGSFENALEKPFEAVITRSMAVKYFGDENVVGESFKINNNDYLIQAVIDDIPYNTHLKFDFLLSHSTINSIMSWYNDYPWGGNNEYTYLLMHPQTNLNTFNEALYDFSVSIKEKIKDEKFTAEPIEDIHLYSNKSFEPEVNGNAQIVYFLLVIGCIIILIAWINYINLSTARAINRAKEVGIRKVVGSSKAQLIFQYFIESAIINLMALVLALVIVKLSLPAFLSIAGHPESISVFSNPGFWMLISGIFLFGIICSGLYPAFVLSSFQPVHVLKGKFKSSGHGLWLRKSLVVFQFAAAVMLIVLASTIYLQINHLQKQSFGIKLDQTIAFRTSHFNDGAQAEKGIDVLKNKLLENRNIQKISTANALPGLSIHEMNTTTGIKPVGKEKFGNYNFYWYSIDEEFFSTLGIKIIAGRNFMPGQENKGGIILNEEAVKIFGFSTPEDAIGKLVDWSYNNEGKPSTIIGVVKNYYQRSPKEPHFPQFFAYNKLGKYVTARFNFDSTQEALTVIEGTWKQLYPDNAFDYFFLDEQYHQQFKADVQVSSVSALFASLAIIIACLGLFGLSSFSITQRTKEIGIRKVLGASITQVVKTLSKDFLILVIISTLIALPVAYIVINQWLENYAARIELSWWIFMIPLVMVGFITIITVASQTIKAAVANPVENLRNE